MCYISALYSTGLQCHGSLSFCEYSTEQIFLSSPINTPVHAILAFSCTPELLGAGPQESFPPTHPGHGLWHLTLGLSF